MNGKQKCTHGLLSFETFSPKEERCRWNDTPADSYRLAPVFVAEGLVKPQWKRNDELQPSLGRAMTSYTDSYNSGNPNIFDFGASGDTFTLGLGLDLCTGISNELYVIKGGYDTYVAPNSFVCSGTGNAIDLVDDHTTLFLLAFDASDNIQTITGGGADNKIVACYTGTSTTLDFSGTRLSGISAIYGTNFGDIIEGSGQGVPTFCGAGNDTILESGVDRAPTSGIKDQVDGGGGFNIYNATGPISQYIGNESVNGNSYFSSGTSWDFSDGLGEKILLSNVQEVVFSNGTTLYAGLSPVADQDASQNNVFLDAATGGTVGLTVSSYDPYPSTTLTYSLVGGSGVFAVDPATGIVTVANGSLIDGSSASYTITVQATDGTLTATGTFTVGVNSSQDLSTLTTAQVATLATAEMAALSTAQLASLTPTQFAVLSAPQIAALIAANVAGLSTAQISALSLAGVGGFTAGQVAALTMPDLAAFSTAQFAALGTSGISGLTSAQAAALSANDVAALTTAQIPALSTSAIAALGTADIALLTPTQIAALGSAQTGALTTADIATLTTTQVASLSTAGIAGLTAAQAAALSTADASALTTAQIPAIKPATIAALPLAE